MKKLLYILFISTACNAQSIPIRFGVGAASATGDVWNQGVGVNSPSWTYSNANKTRNSGAASVGCGISTNAITGNEIAGFYNDAGNTHLESVGISTTSFTNTSFTGGENASYGLLNGLNGFFHSGSTATMTNQTNYGGGDTVWCIKNTANQIWYAKYSSSTHHYVFTGTSPVPSTGAGGVSVTAGTYYFGSGDQHSNILTLITGADVPALLITDCNAGGSTYVYAAHN